METEPADAVTKNDAPTKPPILRKAFIVSVVLLVTGFATFVFGLAVSGGFTPPRWSLRIPEVGGFMMIAGAIANSCVFLVTVIKLLVNRQFQFWQLGNALLFALTICALAMALNF